jgi:hypothetical protein
MDQKRRRIDRSKYEEMRKPVYVLSDLYDDISSEEEECREPTDHLIDVDDLVEISVGSVDWNFIDDLLGESDSLGPVVTGNADSRKVIVTDHAEREDGNEEETGDEDDEKSGKEEVEDTGEEDIDSNNNSVSTICLLMRTTTRTNPDGSEEVTRDSHISYSENVNPEVDIRGVADHILD